MIVTKNSWSRLVAGFWFSAVIVCGGVMLYVSLEARHAEERLFRTYNAIEQEEENIRILKTEIAYLTRPERLQVLVEKYLPLHTTQQEQFITLHDLEDRPLAIVAEQDDQQTDIVDQSVQAMLTTVLFPQKKPLRHENKQVTAQLIPSVTQRPFQSLLNKISGNSSP